MTLVRIIRDYDWPDLISQTPGSTGVWDDIKFTLEPVTECDYVIVLNRSPAEAKVRCPPQRIWALMQEPPNEIFKPMHRGAPVFHRVYTQDESLRSAKYIRSQPALPWHVQKDYDYLQHCEPPRKIKNLSCIMSNKAACAGHRERLRCLKKLRQQLDFDLYGKGFTFVIDKWDALSPYKYSLVFENYLNPFYWSEKIADAILAWTIPIYFGCTRINDYFPEGSVISLDIREPNIHTKIREIIERDDWTQRLEALCKARKLILDQYQLFPFLVREINDRKNHDAEKLSPPENVLIPSQFQPHHNYLTKIGGAMRRSMFSAMYRLD